VRLQSEELRQLREKHKRLQEEIDRLQNQLEVERQNQFGQLQCDLDRLREHYRQLEIERQRLQSDLAEVFSSSTLRLRNRVVGLPLVGTWLKSFARIAAGRSS
jgi:septal ring factor EnvC (AmiA/AmiB activator)